MNYVNVCCVLCCVSQVTGLVSFCRDQCCLLSSSWLLGMAMRRYGDGHWNSLPRESLIAVRRRFPSFPYIRKHFSMCYLHKEGWVPKNWCFRIVVLEKTLKSPLHSKAIKPVNPKGNQPWIFTGKDWCWSWSSNTLVPWCEELTHWKRLKLGKTECKRRRGQQRMRRLDNITDSMDMNLSKLQEIVEDWRTWQAAVHGVTESGPT